MAFEDQVVVSFIADLSNFLSGLERVAGVSRSTAAASQNTQGAARATGQATAQSRAFTQQLNQQNRAAVTASEMLSDLQKQTGGFTSSFRRASMSLQTGTEWLDRFSIQSDRASMMMWKFSMAGLSFQQLGATTGAVAVGFDLMTKKMLDSFSMVDRIERQFTAIYHSAEMGQQAVSYLVAQAPKIRYTVQEVLEAGRLLAIEGFQPKALIYDMADLAAGVNQEGITIVDATRAFVDATNGQFRRLKETFQVSREDAMQFAPDAFAGPNNQISNQAKATDAIIRAIKAKYRGMNEATMQTVQGMMSNVDDAMIKAAAKLGEAIAPTVMVFLKDIMGAFDKVGDFAETGFGKATAQVVMWTAALLSAASALALLSGGFITLLGFFAAYRVFMQSRKGDMAALISSEMELMALNQHIAALEAKRSVDDIKAMRAQLAMLQALNREEMARAELLQLEQRGVTRGGRHGALVREVGAAQADRATAEAAYQRATLPREIVRLQREVEASQAAAVTLTGEELALQRAQTVELQRQLDLKYKALADVGGMGEGAVGPGAFNNRTGRRARSRALTGPNAQAGLIAMQGEAARLEVAAEAERTAQAENGAPAGTLARAELTRLRQRIVKRNADLGMDRDEVAQLRAAREDQTPGGQAAYQRQIGALLARQPTLMARHVALQTQVNTLAAEEAAIRSQIAGRTEAETRHERERLAVIEQETLALRAQMATTEDLAARNAATRGGFGATARGFGRGFGSGFSAVANVALSPLQIVLGPLVQMFQQVAVGIQKFADMLKAAQLANTMSSFIGMLTGGVVALAALIVAAVGVQHWFKALEEQSAEFGGGLKKMSDDAAKWQRNIPGMTPEQRSAAQGQEAFGKGTVGTDKEGKGWATWTAFGNAIKEAAGWAARIVPGADAGQTGKHFEHSTEWGKQILEKTGSLGAAKDVIGRLIQSAAEHGQQINYKGEALTQERLAGMSEEEIKKLVMSQKEYRALVAQTAQDIEKANATTAEANKKIDDQARAYARAQLARKDLTDAEREAYNNIANADDAAGQLRANLEEAATKAHESMADMVNVGEAIAKGATEGKSAAEVKAEFEASAITAAQALKDEETALANISNIYGQITPEQQRQLEMDRAKLSLRKAQVANYDAIKKLLDQTQPAAAAAQAAGMPYGSYITGPSNYTGLVAAANAETDPAKKRQLINEGMKSEIERMNQRAELQNAYGASGPNATPQQRAAELRQQARNEEQRQSSVDDFQRRAVMPYLAADERARAEEALSVQATTSQNKTAQLRKQALEEETKATTDLLEADRRRAALNVQADAQLWTYDKEILAAKLAQADAANDVVGRRQLEAEWAEKTRNAENSIWEIWQRMVGLSRERVSIRGMDREEATRLAQIEYDTHMANAARLRNQGKFADAYAEENAALQAIKQSEDEIGGIQSSRLRYLEALNSQGLLSDEQLEAAKKQYGAYLRWQAGQAKDGSKEQYDLLAQAVDMLGDDTKDKWKGIVGQILGAPQELISNVMSEGWLARQMGGAANILGMGKGIKAEIAGQSSNEMMVRVRWEGLDAVDGRVAAALPAALNAFGRTMAAELGR